MATCKCENCNNTYQDNAGHATRCPYCKAPQLTYYCGSCCKMSGLLMGRESIACPRCNTQIPSYVRDQVANLAVAPPNSPRNMMPSFGHPLPLRLPMALFDHQPPPLTILQQMQAARGQNLVTMYRVCSAVEAENTRALLVAGGQERELERIKPSESETVEQVGNSEGIAFDAELHQRKLALLAKLNGGKVQAYKPPERTVVEFSPAVAAQFSGTVIKVRINQSFMRKGSNLESENGYVVQVGTPLFSVEIVRVIEVKPKAFGSLSGGRSGFGGGGGPKHFSSHLGMGPPRKSFK